MKLTHYIRSSRLFAQERTNDKDALIEKLVGSLPGDLLASATPALTHAQVLDAVRQREGQSATVIGDNVAMPHARLEGLSHPSIALATMAEPIDFDPPRGHCVSIVCLVAIPASDPVMALKIMGALSRFFNTEERTRRMLETDTAEGLLGSDCLGGISIDAPVTARDIMRPPNGHVTPSTPLRAVSHKMFAERLDVVPVVDETHHIVGEITTDEMFALGLPDFFMTLKSVSFIAEFDPFEKYFHAEANTDAGSVMNTNAACMPSDSTLLEIVFALAVKRHPQLYIIDTKGEWVGTIDRNTVLDNVINF